MRGLLAVAMCWSLVACGGASDGTPEGAFKQFAAAVAASEEDPDQIERVYGLLSAADRQVLERRARQVTEAGGPKTTGPEILAQGRVLVRWTPRKVKVRKRSENRAELEVAGTGRERTSIVMVQESGVWRVDLGLAREAP